MATYPSNPSGGSTLGNTPTTGTTRTGSMGSTTDYSRTSPMGASSGMETAETTEQGGKGVTTAIGERLERAGDFLEDKGKGQFIADRLHSAGKYLQDNDARTMVRSIDSAICAHPYRGILIGLGLGWVVGRFLSSKD